MLEWFQQTGVTKNFYTNGFQTKFLWKQKVWPSNTEQNHKASSLYKASLSHFNPYSTGTLCVLLNMPNFSPFQSWAHFSSLRGSLSGWLQSHPSGYKSDVISKWPSLSKIGPLPGSVPLPYLKWALSLAQCLLATSSHWLPWWYLPWSVISMRGVTWPALLPTVTLVEWVLPWKKGALRT